MLTLVCSLAISFAVACRSTESGPVAVGAAAPDYSASSLTGEPVALKDLRGKVVLVNAWATWCKPCLEEIPEFRALHEKYESRGLAVVGVSLDEDTATGPIRDFVKSHAMPYRIWHDPGQTMMSIFKFGGLPTTILVDREGIIRWLSTGKVMPGDMELEAAIKQAIR